MNNKGFAITTILYGIMILFCLLLVSLLSILSSYRKTQELLVEENNGARDIASRELVDDSGFVIDDTDWTDDGSSETSNTSSSSSTSDSLGQSSSSNPASNPSSSNNKVTITFDCKEGTFMGGNKIISRTYNVGGDDINLEDEFEYCRNNGIAANAWNTKSDSTINDITINFKVPDHDETIYAVWK